MDFGLRREGRPLSVASVSSRTKSMTSHHAKIKIFDNFLRTFPVDGSRR